MDSKYQFQNSNIYLPGTEIPKNKLNITNSEELHELERSLIEDAYQVFYNDLNEKTLFDENYFKSLHKDTFVSLYVWAGEFRTFNMSKGSSRFCQGAFVEKNSKKNLPH